MGLRRALRAVVLIRLGLGQEESLRPVDSYFHERLGEEEIGCWRGRGSKKKDPMVGQGCLGTNPMQPRPWTQIWGEASPRSSPLRVILECYLIIYGTPGTSQFPHALLPTRVGGDVGVGGSFRITASLL